MTFKIKLIYDIQNKMYFDVHKINPCHPSWNISIMFIIKSIYEIHNKINF